MGSTTEKLAHLRKLMQQFNLSAYIIPSEDAHQSEYIAPCDARRAFISGFTGSAGFAVVTESLACLWTDGRYFLQAGKQLDQNWTLMKSGLPETPTREAWLNSILHTNSKVGIDPKLISVSDAKKLQTELGAFGNYLEPIDQNLIDLVWQQQDGGKPDIPCNPVEPLQVKYSGRSVADKISTLRSQFNDHNVWGFVVSALDEIAWLFNLRGSDIPYNPVFFAYALITNDDKAFLYVDEKKLSKCALEYLANDSVTILPYHQIFQDLKLNYSATMMDPLKLLIDSRCNFALQEALGGVDTVKVVRRSPVMMDKGVKNETELEGFRQCHIRDAAALIKYFAWLEDELIVKGNTSISEVDGADKLEEFRSQQSGFKGLSFDTISGSGPNGAIIHYKPEKETCSLISADKMYLCDSGGQYIDGTTDVTRTVHFGTPTQHEKECFTRVLKGHIQVDIAKFPKGTTGYVLDILARASLWQVGLDFRHGVGHGVGHYLNVHEGPHGIGVRIAYNDVPLQAGMTVTDEPGYYEDGAFGIRIENVLLVKEADTRFNFGGNGYFGFEHVTVVPIQTKLIEPTLLTPEELDWVNQYNNECFLKVSPLMEKGSLEYKWFERESQPMPV